jgi:hypoxanthine-DNA glycosylase
MTRLQGLPAVIGRDTRCLILGSFPGEVSLAVRQYYGHPTNQFWHLLSCALIEPLAQLPYRVRLARLTARGLGLWDVLQACERHGSLDAAIRNPSHNDFTRLRDHAPQVQAVLFNGGSAGRQAEQLATAGFTVTVLPSSSAAHAGRSFAQKLALWRPAVRSALG